MVLSKYLAWAGLRAHIRDTASLLAKSAIVALAIADMVPSASRLYINDADSVIF
jgi:hypothetical protein